MRVQHNKGGDKRVTIDPGEYFATREGSITLTTLLGSCVSACLFDPVNRVIGMNHFLLANRRYAKDMPVLDSEVGRYGINAMEVLINEMLKQGAKRQNLNSKVFGGGDVLKHYRGQSKGGDNSFFVGEVNSRFVREYLKTEKIPVIASHLGGDHGRVIYFKSDDYSVYMRRISHDLDDKVANEEHRFWEKSIKDHDKKETVQEIQFW